MSRTSRPSRTSSPSSSVCVSAMSAWCIEHCSTESRAVYRSDVDGAAWSCTGADDVACHEPTGLGFETVAMFSLRKLFETHVACESERVAQNTAPRLIRGRSSAPKCALCMFLHIPKTGGSSVSGLLQSLPVHCHLIPSRNPNRSRAPPAAYINTNTR